MRRKPADEWDRAQSRTSDGAGLRLAAARLGSGPRGAAAAIAARGCADPGAAGGGARARLPDLCRGYGRRRGAIWWHSCSPRTRCGWTGTAAWPRTGHCVWAGLRNAVGSRWSIRQPMRSGCGRRTRISTPPIPHRGASLHRSAIRRAVDAALGSLPRDGVLVIGAAGSERDWSLAGRLAGYLPRRRGIWAPVSACERAGQPPMAALFRRARARGRPAMSFEKPGPVEDNWRDAISSVEEIIADARDGRDVHPRRPRGPRERGRPRDPGPDGDARGDQLHGDARARADLPRADRATGSTRSGCR